MAIADYPYEYVETVAIDPETGNLLPNTTGRLVDENGADLPMGDLEGNAITSVTSTRQGVVPPFRSTVAVGGRLDFGSAVLAVDSREVRNAYPVAVEARDKAEAADVNSAAAADSAAASADSAQAAADAAQAPTESAMVDVTNTDGSAFRNALTTSGNKPVGKGELVINAADHGADPTGVASSAAAINAVLAANPKAHVLITGGTYLLDGPINLTSSSHVVEVDASATIEVPSGYTGSVFRFGHTTSMRGAKVIGSGTVIERGKSGGAAVEPGLWAAVEFVGNGVGTTSCTVTGLTFWWVGTFARYSVDAAGWVNGTLVSDVRVMYFRTFMETIKGGTQVGFAGNSMRNIMAQAGQFTEFGVKDLTGRSWVFDNVNLWDFYHAPTAISARIAASAENVVIVGGLVTTQNYTNNAAPGEVTVIDQVQVKPWNGRPTIITAAQIVDDPAGAVKATRAVTDNMPVWEFVDSGTPQAFTSFKAPEGVKTFVVTIYLAGTGAVSGNVRFNLSFRSIDDGSPLAAPIFGRQFVVPVTPGVLVQSSPSTSFIAAAGSTYSVAIARTSAHADDTLADKVGLVGVQIRPVT